MVKVTRGVCDPAMFSKRVPRRDHGSRADVERDGFSIRIINRGEQLSYIDAALGEVVAEIFIPTHWIDADSLELWDFEPARPITDDQRALILDRIVRWWAERNQAVLQVIHGKQAQPPAGA